MVRLHNRRVRVSTDAKGTVTIETKRHHEGLVVLHGISLSLEAWTAVLHAYDVCLDQSNPPHTWKRVV